jgi:hypothetical protein
MPDKDPVKYFDSEIKRLNYYNSQFLVDADFNDEQLYHNQMRRLHNRALHTWGILQGLEVGRVQDKAQVTVAPGAAIDRLGREIVLPAQSAPIELGGFDAGAQVYLTITYDDVFDPADKGAQQGTQTSDDHYTRTTERPTLRPSAGAPAPDSPDLVLAVVGLDRNKAVASVDRSVRRYAGSRFGSSDDGSEFSLYADTAGAWHFYDGAKRADRLAVDANGNLGVGTAGSDGARLAVDTGGGTALSLKCEHRGSNFIVRPLDAGSTSTVIENTGGGALAINPRMGNVSIGTNTPVSRLHVHGDYLNTGAGGFALDASDAGDPEQYVLRINPFALGNSMVGYQFQTKSAVGGVNVPLTFDHAGKVGIGANSPQLKLEVGDGSDGRVLIGRTTPTLVAGSNVGGAIYFGGNKSLKGTDDFTAAIETSWGGGTNPQIGIGVTREFSARPGANVLMDFFGNTSIRKGLASLLYVQNNGNVGIGTTKPLGPLSVGDSSVDDSDGFIVVGKKIKAGGGSRHFRIGFDSNFNFVIGDYGNNNTAAGEWKSPLSVHYGAPSKSLYINSKGKVGLGTTDIGDNSQLKIASGNDFAHFEFAAAGAGELRFVGWANGWNINTQTADKHLYINRDAGDTSDVFIGRAGKELTVKGDTGNVGIGAVKARAPLDVGDTTKNKTKSVLARLAEQDSTGDGTYLGVKSYDTQPVNAKSFAVEHYFGNSINSAINFYRGSNLQGGFIKFATNNGTENMTLDSGGNLSVKGSVSIGDWTLVTSGDALLIKHGTQTVARFSTGRDRIQLYKNLDGAKPYFYYNNEGNFGNYSG